MPFASRIKAVRLWHGRIAAIKTGCRYHLRLLFFIDAFAILEDIAVDFFEKLVQVAVRLFDVFVNAFGSA